MYNLQNYNVMYNTICVVEHTHTLSINININTIFTNSLLIFLHATQFFILTWICPRNFGKRAYLTIA